MIKSNRYALVILATCLLMGCNREHTSHDQPTRTTETLQISQAWVREPPPGAKVAAAYFVAQNPSKQDIVLVAAKVEFVGNSEFHSMRAQDGMMRMRKLDTLRIAAGSRHQFQSGGDHLMLFELQQPLRSGTTLKATLQLDNGQEIPFQLRVQPNPPAAN